MTSRVQSHRDKVKDVILLCSEADDLKVQAMLVRVLIILASAYIEISLKEIVGEFAEKRSSPSIAKFIKTTISYENSLNCKKIESIVGRLGVDYQSCLKPLMSDETRAAIDSLKALRDVIAHGGENATGHIVITKYFKAIEKFPDILRKALRSS